MDHFNYDADGQLQAEQLPLQQLAEQYGTPLYVYSRATLERHWHAFDKAAGGPQVAQPSEPMAAQATLVH